MRLIDLDDDRHTYVGNDGEYERWNIDPDAPSIDAVPVKHGKWVADTDGILHCSNCTRVPVNRIIVSAKIVYGVDIKKQMKFCPNCGARMEEDNG